MGRITGERYQRHLDLLRAAVLAGDVTVADASRILGVTRRPAERYLSLLERCGLIERTVGLPGRRSPRQPATRRRRVWVPTAAGRATLTTEGPC